MSTTPQMSHMGQQQGQQYPSTSPYQQPFGQQQGYGQQQAYGMSGSLEQLQQLGRQQPFQQLLQQLGQPQGHGQQQGYGQALQGEQQQQQSEQQVLHLMQQVTQAAVQQAPQAGVADGYIDIVQPLPGQPSQIFLRIHDVFRVFNNPNPQIHSQVQEAFAHGHQVVGVWDSSQPLVLRSIQIRRI
ncbi:hypothetical protein ACWHLZ_42215 [Streptomyces chartreusis]|uniref:hypothetical protein n=1 Tax=Streptomyces TaxID=1883 RepID=UPI002E81191A|nr:hypothetical protein [Streptomyces chartreusis]WSZ70820.1 hypothetical protein OG938_35200 [Streptomyces chartreusis]WTA26203.1 hypothetical protein OIA45_09380 [Streptomyces chartreusis]WUB16847.1 hypothetical protein OG997_09095 [Streptomyces chartreusis]